MCFVSWYSGQWFYDFIIFLLHINNSALDPRACFSKVLLTKSKAVLFSFKIGVPKENENYEPRIDTTKIPRPPPLSLYTIIMSSLFYFLSEFYSKNWCKRSTEIIIYTVCLFYSTICCWTKREKLSVGSAVLFGQWTICPRSRAESYHSGLRYNGIWDL